MIILLILQGFEASDKNKTLSIAFNSKKSINCQARSVAIGVSLYKKDIFFDVVSDRKLFKNTIYIAENTIKNWEQIALFD